MEFRPLTDAADDADTIRAFLAMNEVAHHMLLRLLDRVLAGGSGSAKQHRIASLRDGERVIGMLVRTPAQKILWSEIAPRDQHGAVECAIASFDAKTDALTGSYGPGTIADLFAERWTQATTQRASLVMRYQHYELERVTPPAPTPGRWRTATNDDVDLLVRYANEFFIEAQLPEEDRALGERERVSALVRTGESHIWELEGRAVAVASTGGTARVRQIDSVYTPPDLRKRGFASALVATVSQRFLDAGAWRVSLSTDSRNETASRVYEAVGYRRVGDGALYAFK